MVVSIRPLITDDKEWVIGILVSKFGNPIRDEIEMERLL